ncbi:MAG: Mur ligase family protein [Methanomicrobiales archaeon]
MKVAVVGLGVEGKKAVESLNKNGYYVYASDINPEIEIHSNDLLDVDLGFHDFDKIEKTDAILISPSLWNSSLGKSLRSNKPLISDVLCEHKSIFTIGVTGTNGKTTTSFMIKEILEEAGLSVLMGGNAGGGFEGYMDLILQASKNNYQILLVEICDMTMDFASHFFDLDLIVVTNIGRDHLNFHKNLQNYRDNVCKFIEGKTAILNENDPYLVDLKKCAHKTIFFGFSKQKIKLFGRFNLSNAAAAEKVAKCLKIPDDKIRSALENFNTVDGRLKTINIRKSNILIGKTDNVDAVVAVFNEVNFDAVIIGTPRKDEICRLDILDEIINYNPKFVGLFDGLDKTADDALKILQDKGFEGSLKKFENIKDIVNCIYKFSDKYHNIFVGGNGQSKIIEIENRLKDFK